VPLVDPILAKILKDQIEENPTHKPAHRRNRLDTLWAQEQSQFHNTLNRACKVAGV